MLAKIIGALSLAALLCTGCGHKQKVVGDRTSRKQQAKKTSNRGEGGNQDPDQGGEHSHLMGGTDHHPHRHSHQNSDPEHHHGHPHPHIDGRTHHHPY